MLLERSYFTKKMSPFVYAFVFILISCKSRCVRAGSSKMSPDLMLKQNKERERKEKRASSMNQRALSGKIIRRSLLQSGLTASGSRVYHFTWSFMRIQLSEISGLDGAEKCAGITMHRGITEISLRARTYPQNFFQLHCRLPFMNKSGFLLFQCKRTGFNSEIRVHAE